MSETTIKDKSKEKQQQQQREIALKHAFYNAHNTTKGVEIQIDRLNILEILTENGFHRYDIDITNSSYMFIQVKKRVVSQVSITQIRDFWFNYLEQLKPYRYPTGKIDEESGENITISITPEMLINKFLGSIGNYLSDQILDRLQQPEDLEFNQDTKTEKFMYYSNGFVTINRTGVHFNPNYNELKKYIWHDQILSRQFNPEITTKQALNGVFGRFCFNICGQNPTRLTALKTLIGYSLHNFRDYKLKAVVLTDSFIGHDGEANGRTGKGVFAMALGYMLNNEENQSSKVYTNVNGKNWDIRDKHRYADANATTSLIHLEDIKAYFNIENLFNDITEGVIVDKKNEKPFRIQPKFIISTNKTLKIEGGSSKDRVLMFEFSDHYSKENSPEDEFKHWLFREWKNERANEWQLFDFFCCEAIQQFFINDSKPMEPEVINLGRRSLLEHTSQEFVNFMDYLHFNETTPQGTPKGTFIVPPPETVKEYDKKELYNKFLESYEDFKNDKRFNQAKFTKWLKKYAEEVDFLQPITEFDQRRSCGKDYITFKRQFNNQTDETTEEL